MAVWIIRRSRSGAMAHGTQNPYRGSSGKTRTRRSFLCLCKYEWKDTGWLRQTKSKRWGREAETETVRSVQLETRVEGSDVIEIHVLDWSMRFSLSCGLMKLFIRTPAVLWCLMFAYSQALTVKHLKLQMHLSESTELGWLVFVQKMNGWNLKVNITAQKGHSRLSSVIRVVKVNAYA